VFHVDVNCFVDVFDSPHKQEDVFGGGFVSLMRGAMLLHIAPLRSLSSILGDAQLR
jgi:hypothetical protein